MCDTCALQGVVVGAGADGGCLGRDDLSVLQGALMALGEVETMTATPNRNVGVIKLKLYRARPRQRQPRCKGSLTSCLPSTEPCTTTWGALQRLLTPTMPTDAVCLHNTFLFWQQTTNMPTWFSTALVHSKKEGGLAAKVAHFKERNQATFERVQASVPFAFLMLTHFEEALQ
jgi:hypothetical protein